MTDNRSIRICDQTWQRKFWWPGGVYYIDFAKDSSEIIVWIHENIKTRNIKIINDEHFENTSKYDHQNIIKTGTYKLYFRRRTDFIGFKLRWL